MGALEKVSAMIRSLPGMWEIIVSHCWETKSLDWNRQFFKVFRTEHWHQRLVMCVDVKCHPNEVV